MLLTSTRCVSGVQFLASRAPLTAVLGGVLGAPRYLRKMNSARWTSICEQHPVDKLMRELIEYMQFVVAGPVSMPCQRAASKQPEGHRNGLHLHPPISKPLPVRNRLGTAKQITPTIRPLKFMLLAPQLPLRAHPAARPQSPRRGPYIYRCTSHCSCRGRRETGSHPRAPLQPES